MNTRLERGYGTVKPNQFVCSRMSDTSNSSGALTWNQTRTHNSTRESGSSSTLTVKATYRDDTVRFKEEEEEEEEEMDYANPTLQIGSFKFNGRIIKVSKFKSTYKLCDCGDANGYDHPVC